MKRKLLKTSDLYETAFFTFCGAQIVECYGGRNSKVWAIRVGVKQLFCNILFAWFWKGLRDQRIKLKNISIRKTASLTLKAKELGIDKHTQEIRDAREFLKRFERLNGKVLKR